MQEGFHIIFQVDISLEQYTDRTPGLFINRDIYIHTAISEYKAQYHNL